MATYLTTGYIIRNELHEEYTICKVLGRGASTIAYLADYVAPGKMSAKRVVKEYCPAHMDIVRLEDGSLQVNADSKQHFDEGLQNFELGSNRQNEIRSVDTLANMTPAIQSTFRANNTAYQDVMPFIGETFDNNQGLSLLERIRICLSIAKLVKRYHEAGYLCLDIKPNNIMVLDTTALSQDVVNFIDFDSIRKKSEVAFGKSLSFTEHWAAPEQTNPYKFAQISERTDIYTIGELVFWSVFGRHSTEKEHRSFSHYPFDDTSCPFYQELDRMPVQRALSALWGKALRSSVRNRFNSLDAAIDLLNDVVSELSKDEFLITSCIQQSRCFIAREDELKVLETNLASNDLVFVSGVAGIGKSELVKKYISLHQNDYHTVLYWPYDGNLQTMVCDDSCVSVANLIRFAKESDADYCRRKLAKIKALLPSDSIIVIDNLDVLVEELHPADVWLFIKSMPCKIVVTTRCDERHYSQLKLGDIAELPALRQLFYTHCPSSVHLVNQISHVDQIIKIAHRHTYEIVLFAAYTEAKMQTPEDTLSDMSNIGFSTLDGTMISLYKDNTSASQTFENHIKSLFSMAGMSDAQKMLLLKLSFLPAVGMHAKEICAFYDIADHNDLNWLVSHGFVLLTPDPYHNISVHSSVASAIIDISIADTGMLNKLYKSIFVAMRKGYDDVSVNQDCFDRFSSYIDESVLCGNDTAEAKASRETVRKKFERDYAKSAVSSKEYIVLCNSLALKTVEKRIDNIYAAKFIVQYVEWFVKYGHYSLLEKYMLYALSVYDTDSNNTYVPDREYAYSIYVDLLFRENPENSELVDVCKKHLALAKKAKDWDMASYWYTSIAKCLYSLRRERTLLYQLKATWYSLRQLWQRGSRREQNRNSFSLSTTKHHIRSAELHESICDVLPPADKPSAFLNLKAAIWIRKKALPTYEKNVISDNAIRISIDEARICSLQQNFLEAQTILLSSLKTVKEGSQIFTSAMLDTYELLGDVYTYSRNYAKANDAFAESLSIAEELDIQDTYYIRIKQGRVLNLQKATEEALAYNSQVLTELLNSASGHVLPVLADAYYNMGMANILSEDFSKAEECIGAALRVYESMPQLHFRANIGKARCYESQAHIDCYNGNYDNAALLMQKAVEVLTGILGEEDPETISCLEQYNRIKSRQLL